MNEETFPGFYFQPGELTNYIASESTFILALVPDGVIRFQTPFATSFRNWLSKHGVRDIGDEVGDLVKEIYFGKGSRKS